MTFRMWLLVVLSFAVSTNAGAQTRPDGGSSDARFHLGPLQLIPTIALTNAGVDNNVFNAADVDQPKSDFTMTVTPRTDAWIRLGRVWVIGAINEDLVYYREFASERSINSTSRGTLWLPLNRLTMEVGAGYTSTRDRPGYEIDMRSRHSEGEFRAALEVRAFGKTHVGVAAEREQVAFQPDAVFLGHNLERELNRTTTHVGVTIRHGLTPVTDLTLLVAREEDRFEFSPIRDSNSTRIEGALKFHARIGGSATFGYRDFQPLAADVEPYRGPTASVDMSIAPFGATRFGIQATRDLQYSYDITQPYYVETGTGLSITQGLFGPFDIVGRYGIQELGYRGRLSATMTQDRTDFIHRYGGGVGYRVGRDMRIGFNVEMQRRTSDVAVRGYEGVRFGTSVTYGF